MKKPRCTFFIAFLIQINCFSQEKKSSLTYNLSQKTETDLNLYNSDTLINGFVGTENIFPVSNIFFFDFETNKKRILNPFINLEINHLFTYNRVNSDSLNLIVRDSKKQIHVLGFNLRNSKNSIVKTFEYSEKTNYINNYFFKNGIITRDENSVIYQDLKIPNKISELIFKAKGDNLFGFHHDLENYMVVTKDSIIINGVKSNLEPTYNNTPIIKQFKDKFYFINQTRIVQFTVQNNQIIERLLFENHNLNISNYEFIHYTINDKTKFLTFEDELKEVAFDNEFVGLTQKWENNKYLLEQTTAPGIIGRVIYNYFTDKSINSKFLVIGPISENPRKKHLFDGFIKITTDRDSLMSFKLSKVDPLSQPTFFVVRIKNGQYIFDTYETIKQKSNTSFLCINQMNIIGSLNTENFTFDNTQKLNSIIESQLEPYFPNSYGFNNLKIGQQIIASFLNNPIKLDKKINEFKVNIDYSLYPFRAKHTVAKDSILLGSVNNEGNLIQQYLNSKNPWVLYRKTLDSLFFYNENLKATEVVVLKNKGNQELTRINYIGNNEIHILQDSELIIKSNSGILKHDFKDAKSLSTYYFEAKNILFHTSKTSDTSGLIVYFLEGKFHTFSFTFDPRTNYSILNNSLTYVKNKQNLVVDILNMELRLSYTQPDLKHIHSWGNFEVFLKNTNLNTGKSLEFYNYETQKFVSYNHKVNLLSSSNNLIEFLWAEGDNVFFKTGISYPISPSTKEYYDIYKINLKTFIFSKLNEVIYSFDSKNLKFIVRKDQNHYLTSFYPDSLYLPVNLFFNPPYGYDVYKSGMTKDNLSDDYYSFASVNQNPPQLYKFSNDVKKLKNLKWEILQTLNLNDLVTPKTYLKIYPNPSGYFNIDIESLKPISQVLIFDLQGRLLHDKEIIFDTGYQNPLYVNNMAAEDELRLYFFNANSGTYIIKFKMLDNSFQTRKFIKL